MHGTYPQLANISEEDYWNNKQWSHSTEPSIEFCINSQPPVYIDRLMSKLIHEECACKCSLDIHPANSNLNALESYSANVVEKPKAHTCADLWEPSLMEYDIIPYSCTSPPSGARDQYPSNEEIIIDCESTYTSLGLHETQSCWNEQSKSPLDQVMRDGTEFPTYNSNTNHFIPTYDPCNASFHLSLSMCMSVNLSGEETDGDSERSETRNRVYSDFTIGNDRNFVESILPVSETPLDSSQFTSDCYPYGMTYPNEMFPNCHVTTNQWKCSGYFPEHPTNDDKPKQCFQYCFNCVDQNSDFIRNDDCLQFSKPPESTIENSYCLYQHAGSSRTTDPTTLMKMVAETQVNDADCSFSSVKTFHPVNLEIPSNASNPSLLCAMHSVQRQKETLELVDHNAEQYLSTTDTHCALSPDDHICENEPNAKTCATNKQPSVCFLCARVYARPSTLKTHLRTHSGFRPYQCFRCGKKFSQVANLTAHMRTHSGDRPFQCPVCHRSFSQSSSVTTHMRTHSGERPYKCHICAKAFADSSTLTKHIRVHSGEKPYRCDQCCVRFSQSGNLKRHSRIHLKADTQK
ncbi:Protein glass [Fasciola gigantica]|uniref:Protein glass n=1 Tax=Fasciola gigantica TaxID=46835 RepID=A0A504YH01_FASGI|nr:Protein glass [Fasciola gigantica]